MNQQNYRRLISGKSSGLSASILRFFLRIAARVYSFVITLRHFLYDKKCLKVQQANAPVISVGNITTGGTGKTPLVIWLYQQIVQSAKCKVQNCGILTRGYKTTKNLKLKTQKYSDEPAILVESCRGATVIVNPDRVAGANEAVNKFGAKILIMDDGFQHRRLARDLDIVIIDATVPFGYGKLLPAGLLREPATSLKRADAVVITRCDQTTEAELTQLEDKLQQINPDMIIARSIHAPISAKSSVGKEIGLKQLKDKKVFAFCGIGNPDAFLNTITSLDVTLVGSKVYNDHYNFTDDCLYNIYEQASHLNADLILTTKKDWFSSPLSTKQTSSDKPRAMSNEIPFAYLEIQLKVISGEEKITRLIEDALAGKI